MKLVEVVVTTLATRGGVGPRRATAWRPRATEELVEGFPRRKLGLGHGRRGGRRLLAEHGAQREWIARRPRGRTDVVGHLSGVRARPCPSAADRRCVIRSIGRP